MNLRIMYRITLLSAVKFRASASTMRNFFSVKGMFVVDDDELWPRSRVGNLFWAFPVKFLFCVES